MGISERWKKYVARKSRLALFFDVVFIVMLLAVIVPPSRHWMMTNVTRLTLFSPRELTELDYLADNAYDVTLLGDKGDTIRLSEMRDQVLMLNFWATWCPPCVAEFPSLQQLYGEYGQHVAFVLISDEEKGVVHRFKEKNGYTIPTYRVLGALPLDLQYSALPTTMVVSKKGRIVIRKVGAARWDGAQIKEVLQRLLDE